MLILPDDSTKSRTLLDQAIADKFKITMIVMGDGHGEDVVASKADVRAEAMPSTRRVVWVRDTRLLTAKEKADWTHGDDQNVACALDLDDRSAAWLTVEQGHSLGLIELAFGKAQQGAEA